MLKLKSTILTKILLLLIYSIAIIALIFIMVGFFSNIKLEYGTEDEISALAMKFYKNIDKGDYENIYNYIIEGKWEKTDADEDIKYSFAGIYEKNYFLRRYIKEFGKDGWKINNESLSISGENKITRSEFKNYYQCENNILDYIDPKNNIKYINIIEINGYNIGTCSIREWRRKIPIVWYKDNWKIILPGSPESLNVLHREGIFSNIELKNIENLNNKL